VADSVFWGYSKMKKLVALALLLGCGMAQAAILSYSVTVEVAGFDSELYDAFVVGDRYTYIYSIDDSVLDSNYTTTAGYFLHSLSVEAFAHEANSGSFDPSLGTDPNETYLFTHPTSMSMSTTGPVYANGYRLTNAYLSISSMSFNDTGLGQTFADQVGGTFELPQDLSAMNFEMGFSDGGPCFECWYVDTRILSVSAVPAPAAVWLFGSGLGLLGWMRRKA
jgi:hypothetical protein